MVSMCDAEYDPKRGGLPAPVGAQDAEHIAFVDLKIKIIDRSNRTVTFAQVLDAQDRGFQCFRVLLA